METNNHNGNIPPAAAPQSVPLPPSQYYAAPPFTRTPKTPVVFDKTDSLFSALAFVIGFLFFEFIFFGGLGFGVPLFFIAAYAGVLFYGLKSKSMDIKKGAPLSVPAGKQADSASSAV